jgi:hypothetical protein
MRVILTARELAKRFPQVRIMERLSKENQAGYMYLWEKKRPDSEMTISEEEWDALQIPIEPARGIFD